MSALQEFLKQQSIEERAAADKREMLRREWVAALERLMSRLTDWLHEADQEKVLQIEPIKERIRERRIGTYEAPGLQIFLGTREIRIKAIALFSIGSVAGDAFGTTIRDGRVDITDGGEKYMLYRGKNGQDEGWIIVNDRDYRPQPLNREAFEAAILSLLK